MSAEGERKTDTIPQWKKEEVDDLVDTIESYDSIGIVNIAGIPSRQLQKMRRNIHGTAELRVSRNTLMVRALEKVDEGLEDLTGYISGQVGLICTNANPFGLYKELEASKTAAPINAGEVAPNDIVIPEGDTGMDPGQFVGELQAVGADARIQEGSIQVLSDSQVLDAGEVVDDQLANVLSELGIEPKEVGLDLQAVFSDGVLFEPDELELDAEQYQADIEAATARAQNLSINAVYPTAQTAGALLSKAAGEAKSLGIQAAIEDENLMPDLLSKADGQVRALAAQIDDPEALPDDLQDAIEEEEEPEEEAAEDADTDSEESTDDESEADDAQADDDTDDDDDDGGDAGDAMGEMFG
jgi:large subunit ribosomal protein L10